MTNDHLLETQRSPVMDTNYSHHIHSKHPKNDLGLNLNMKYQLFDAIAYKEARGTKSSKIRKITKYLDTK